MKYLWLTIPLLFTGCTSIKYVTVEKGQIITDRKQPATIVGNPPMICHYTKSPETFSGYFMYKDDDGSILLDNFGRGTIRLNGSPICELKLDTNESE